MNLVAQTKPGDRVNVQIMRNGQTLELPTEIGVRPQLSAPTKK